MKKIRGFTLVELLVVIILIGILSAIAIPITRANLRRAIITEAVTALGTIRSAERMFFVESGRVSYLQCGAYFGGSIADLPAINPGDLDGTFFSENCYFVSLTATGFSALCAVVPFYPTLKK